MWPRLQRILYKPVHIAPLATFRILFGAMMLISTARFMILGWIEDHYVAPKFHFKYFGFDWVEPLSASGLYAVHFILIAASLCLMLGLFYRVAAILVFLCFTYTELIDLTYYLNHYYFVSLISFLMIFVPANRYLSLDVLRKPEYFMDTIPSWCINIFKIQIAIVYIYAGLFKINGDWLIHALPLKIWLPANDTIPFLGPIFSWKLTPYIFSWIGMLYDTTIVFWLLWDKSRPWAYLMIIVFHILVGILFQIGVFPMVMIGVTLIFFSTKWHLRWQQFVAERFMPTHMNLVNSMGFQNLTINSVYHRAIVLFLSLYLIFQILFPWRFILYPGNVFWTEQGYRFGWRVMLMEKAGTAIFYVKDSKTGKEGEVYNGDFLNPHQEKQMAMQPDMILDYAHYLGKYYEKQGMFKPEVRAVVYVTLNARPSKLFIDSTMNLMTVKDGWSNKDWILK
jgi:hypothetical protein